MLPCTNKTYTQSTEAKGFGWVILMTRYQWLHKSKKYQISASTHITDGMLWYRKNFVWDLCLKLSRSSFLCSLLCLLLAKMKNARVAEHISCAGDQDTPGAVHWLFPTFLISNIQASRTELREFSSRQYFKKSFLLTQGKLRCNLTQLLNVLSGFKLTVRTLQFITFDISCSNWICMRLPPRDHPILGSLMWDLLVPNFHRCCRKLAITARPRSQDWHLFGIRWYLTFWMGSGSFCGTSTC